MKLLFLVFFYCCSLFAWEGAYVTKPQDFYPVCGNTYLELKNLPPLRDQGYYGTCYAHSSMLLLEHLRCSKSSNPVACYAERGSVLHLARYFNTTSEDMIKIGGDATTILSRFGRDRKLSKEDCAPYSAWMNLSGHYAMERSGLKVSPSDKNEVDYFYYISEQIRLGKATQEAKTCWAQDIVEAGVQENVDDVMKILNEANNLNWKELRYKIMVPEKCKQDMLTYPDYEITTYPKRYGGQRTVRGIRNYIFQNLKNGNPVEVSFCAEKDSEGKCGYHSSTVVGQRHVCDKNSCRSQFKIQNSYGRAWQESYDNGWVDSENLSQQMLEHESLNLTSIVPKGQKLNEKLEAPYFQASPVKRDSGFNTLREEGLSAIKSNEVCWRVKESDIQLLKTDPANVKSDDRRIDSRPEPTPPDKRPNVGPREKGKLYRCKGPNGDNYFGDQWIDGWDCKEVKI